MRSPRSCARPLYRPCEDIALRFKRCGNALDFCSRPHINMLVDVYKHLV